MRHATRKSFIPQPPLCLLQLSMHVRHVFPTLYALPWSISLLPCFSSTHPLFCARSPPILCFFPSSFCNHHLFVCFHQPIHPQHLFLHFFIFGCQRPKSHPVQILEQELSKTRQAPWYLGFFYFSSLFFSAPLRVSCSCRSLYYICSLLTFDLRLSWIYTSQKHDKNPFFLFILLLKSLAFPLDILTTHQLDVRRTHEQTDFAKKPPLLSQKPTARVQDKRFALFHIPIFAQTLRSKYTEEKPPNNGSHGRVGQEEQVKKHTCFWSLLWSNSPRISRMWKWWRQSLDLEFRWRNGRENQSLPAKAVRTRLVGRERGWQTGIGYEA